jgi:predicted nucleic acid-binding protein
LLRHFKRVIYLNPEIPHRADEKAALVWARLMSEGRTAGKPRSDLDMIVAAVAETNECVIVTDNEKHFSGLNALNPLRTVQ